MARMDTDGGQPGLPFASVWERECPARSKPGSAGVSPQAWERGRLARLRAGGARTQVNLNRAWASRPHTLRLGAQASPPASD
jgi:hypothetical protein